MVLRSRPLSPHLGVYRLPFTAVLSIVHRATGGLLFLGLSFFSWLLVVFHFFPEQARSVLTYWPCRFAVHAALITFAGTLCYHYCNGIRHLIWDCGYCLGKLSSVVSGCVMLFMAALLAVVMFFIWF
ncbi:MAG: succinate dehydrogenase, cytochrome b556 subunit [Aaplasma endosymbiont of Hyalomma asiaticum]